MTGIPRLRPHSSAIFLSYGFRPFFFFGACYAAFAMALWILFFRGEIVLPTQFAPRDWHVHEMVFGYVAAVLAGFLLTAIPNWTGRLPLQGTPLLILVLAWGAGRIAVLVSAQLGWLLSALIDIAFLSLVVAATAREIVAGQNWRNLKVLIPVAIFALANVAFHVEAHALGIAEYSTRLALAAILVLLTLIGGRIVPSFTHNWLARKNPGRLPTPFGKYDALTIAVSAVALAIWIVSPQGIIAAGALMIAGTLQLVRLARWAGERTAGERLVLILHVAYVFLPFGFILTSLSCLGMILPSAGLHAWMAGAVGTMTLAVMTRASLGHTGHDLVAGPGTQVIYAAIVLGALARVAAALVLTWALILTQISAYAWIAAFSGFALLYGPTLFQSRRGTVRQHQ